MKKWLLRILIGVFVLIVIALGGICAVWMKPELVLTDARVNQLFDKYAGEYFSKKPSGLKLKLAPFGFFGKHLSLDARDFCYKDPEACFKQIHIELSFRFLTYQKVKLESLGPLSIEGEAIRYGVEKAKPEAGPKKDSGSLSDHLEIPSDLTVKDILIDLPKIDVEADKLRISGSFNATGKELSEVTLKADAKSNQNLAGNLLIHTGFNREKASPFDLTLHFQDGISVDGNLKGEANWQKLEGSLTGGLAVKHIMPWLNTVFVQNLSIARKDGKSKVSADLDTRLDQTLASDQSKSVLPKVRINTLIRGKLTLEEKNGLSEYTLKLGPTEDKGVIFKTWVEGKLPIPEKEAYRFGIDKAQVSVAIPVFKNFVNSLRRTNYAVPAPFSSLEGDLKLTVGRDDGEIKNDTLPLSFDTNLDSTQQTVKTNSRAKIEFVKANQKINIDGQTDIHSIRFTLPDLKVLEPAPLVKNDPRLIASGSEKVMKVARPVAETPAEEPEKPSRVNLNWKVNSDPSAIKLYHRILKPYAPIEVKWTVGKTSEGSIELRPFEIEYLNRIAKVRTLRFFQNPNDAKLRYEGKIIIKKTDYTIIVDIIQDGEKPKIVFTSDPPLEQSDIISVLLFNQTTAELDSDQTNSVASTQSAVTSRALGLFSILALSSTPVEAVNFNPSTGIYSARVKLANGLTATVGTDWDRNQEVALRKRLGKNFVLSTIIENDPETNSETRKTLIEWFKRF